MTMGGLKLNQVSVTKFKTLKVEDIKPLLPLEITADGEVIGVISGKEIKGEVQCPNCKMKFNAENQREILPFFLSGKHPKG